MNVARFLMITSEALAGVGIVSHFLLPTSWEVAYHVSPRLDVGIPIRWFVPLALISLAGAFSIASLWKMCIALAAR